MNTAIKSGLVIVGLCVLVYVLLGGKEPVAEKSAVPTVAVASEFVMTPISHASFVFELGDLLIFNDPVGDPEFFLASGTPEVILLSDIHPDHLNAETLAALVREKTVVIAPPAVAALLAEDVRAHTTVLANGEETTVGAVRIAAVPMYNLPEAEDAFHPKGRGNGYLLEYADTRIYIAGDTADIPEMRALTDIDYAFIPMNLPYTMTVEAAADAVVAFAPTVVYPYHYRGPEGLSDIAAFTALVAAANPDIEVRAVDWYPVTEETAE